MKNLYSLIIITFLVGCASFSEGLLPKLDIQKVQDQNKKISLSYSFKSYINFIGIDEIQKDRLKEGDFMEVLAENGYYFSRSINGQVDKSADINIQIKFEHSGNPASLIPYLITTFSFYFIPSWLTEYYKIQVNILTKDDKKYSYEVSDSILTIRWIPLYLLPNNLDNFRRETKLNMWKNLFYQMQRDGVLPKQRLVTQ